jgi:hypothetical protein
MDGWICTCAVAIEGMEDDTVDTSWKSRRGIQNTKPMLFPIGYP